MMSDPNKPEEPMHDGGAPHDEEEDDFRKEMESFDALLDEHLPGGEPSKGEVMELRVVVVKPDVVVVDFGGKQDATIPIGEFPIVDGKPAVAVGDMIKVVQVGRRDDGTPRLSHRQARNRDGQKLVREAMDAHRAVKGIVKETVKGGVMVDIGLDAFMPASQVDLFKIPDLNSLVGKEIEAYVLEFDPRRNRAVLSRRELLVERRDNERKGFLKGLEVGTVTKGRIKSCLDFGVFVDLGIVDGFIPREEVSWDRGKAPGDILKPGDEVDLKVLSAEPENGKITLSRKRLFANPWDTAPERFPQGSSLRGKVVAVETYGAFVQIEEGLTGMIHASDMSWAPGNKKPEDYLRMGDEITAMVLEINRDKKRISLGLKQLAQDPWVEVEQKYAPRSRHKGVVTSIANYGAFVKLDDGVEGMVHVTDLSWEKRVGHPKDYLTVGQAVDVVVLKCDREKRRISLSIKALQDSPYDAYLKEHPVGSVVTGKVTRFAPFGAFVELLPGLEGLIHISQIDTKRVELPEHVLQPGEEVTVKIIGVEKKNRKISLSRRDALRAQEREEGKQYMRKKDDSQSGGMSFGEALRAAKERKDQD